MASVRTQVRVAAALNSAMFLLSIVALPARADERREKITFAQGQTKVVVKSTIKGDESVSYTLDARAGQTLKVVLRTNNRSNYFNVAAPGSQSEAVFVGAVVGRKFEAALTKDGTYTIDVYLMRNAARRDERASASLEVTLTGGAPADTSPDIADGLSGGPDYWAVIPGQSEDGRTIRKSTSASSSSVGIVGDSAVLQNFGCKLDSGRRWCLVKETGDGKPKGWVIGDILREGAALTAAALPTKFDASGKVKCSAARPTGFNLPDLSSECEFRVTRRQGAAELWLLKPGTANASRFLSFETNAFKTDDSGETTWLRVDDNWAVGIDGAEFYFIPDALIFGG